MFGMEEVAACMWFTESNLKFISTDTVTVLYSPWELQTNQSLPHLSLNHLLTWTKYVETPQQIPVAYLGTLCFTKDSQSGY